jgi:hypothetical protein
LVACDVNRLSLQNSDRFNENWLYGVHDCSLRWNFFFAVS